MIKVRTIAILLAISLLSVSCGTTNEVSTADDRSEEAVIEENNNAIGKVVLSDEGCTVKVILEDDNKTCYYPVNLDDKFKVDGAYLQFQKYPSRAPLPAGCESCRAITLENVVRLKR